MRHLAIIFSVMVVFVFISCEKEKEEPKAKTEQVPPGMHSVKAVESMDASNYTYINVDEHGKSIGEIFSEINKLNGKIVKVRGKVMKFNPGIMGTNWIHIQDGTSSQSDY